MTELIPCKAAEASATRPQERFSALLPAPGPTMLLSLGEASKLVGVSKSTIWRAVQSGQLSPASRTDKGEYRLQPSELRRVFPRTRRAAVKAVDATAAQIAGLEQQLAFAREQLEKAERDRDAWRAQAEAAQRLLLGWRWGGEG